jgi:cyanobactin maturation PatA/PatG family protease
MADAQAAEELPDMSGAGHAEMILNELRTLRDQVAADTEVCVAILDGPVDLSHPCFRGAHMRRVDTLVGEEAGPGPMSAHGTHVASVVFGQPFSGTLGLAPGCRGVVAPVFRDNSGYLSQLDLARAIERSVNEGATVVNISGGERVAGGEPDPLLARAIEMCEQSGVLIVAATGNDGCDCVHVPAAIPTVLAVGALARSGVPVRSSNFGASYASHGVLAPGEKIPGAVPGGAITTYTGSSFATPIVSALAALLLCEQRRLTGTVDVAKVREAIIASALPCLDVGPDEQSRCLRGILSVRGAHELITRGGEVTELNAMYATHVAAPGGAMASRVAGVVPSGSSQAGGDLPPMDPGPPPAPPVNPTTLQPATATAPPPQVAPSAAPYSAPAALHASAYAPVAVAPAPPPDVSTMIATPSVSAVVPSGGSCSCGTKPSGDAPSPPEAAPATAVTRVFAIGTVGFDFGTEARRDTFRQLMPVSESGDSPPIQREPNPYDAFQLSDYLDSNPWDSTKVIWTMNLDLTPVYAIEAEVTYAEPVYELLRAVLRNQVLPEFDANFVSRVSFPGVLTDRTVRLFSGQVVPVLVVQRRGLAAWNEQALVSAVVDAIDLPTVLDSIGIDDADAARRRLEQKVRQMLDKVYYELRNLGTSPQDRAINYMATNAFNYTETIAKGLLSGEVADSDTTVLYSLESISAVKSPYCRIDSDCWDVRFTFFAPDNDRRARVVYQTTVDVSDELPVTLSPMRQYLVGGS